MEDALAYLEQHGIKPNAAQQLKLEAFVAGFMAYNAHTNISAIREDDAIWLKHVADSLMLLNMMELKGRAIDVGTGGGLPGIPLAIMSPKAHITLCDSVGKKAKACESFVTSLSLANADVVHGRAEQEATHIRHKHAYDVVLARATAYLPTILAWSDMLLASGGSIVLYKTPSHEELADGAATAKQLGLHVADTKEYELAGQTRTILRYERIRH